MLISAPMLATQSRKIMLSTREGLVLSLIQVMTYLSWQE